MTEHQMYVRMKELITGQPIILQRINQQRVPDIFFRTPKAEGWIELKVISTKGGIVRIPFRPGQFAWIQDYVRVGGLAELFCIDMDAVLWVVRGKKIKTVYSIEGFVYVAEHTDWTMLNSETLRYLIEGEMK